MKEVVGVQNQVSGRLNLGREQQGQQEVEEGGFIVAVTDQQQQKQEQQQRQQKVKQQQQKQQQHEQQEKQEGQQQQQEEVAGEEEEDRMYWFAPETKVCVLPLVTRVCDVVLMCHPDPGVREMVYEAGRCKHQEHMLQVRVEGTAAGVGGGERGWSTPKDQEQMLRVRRRYS
jgi:hypothetical protein